MKRRHPLASLLSPALLGAAVGLASAGCVPLDQPGFGDDEPPHPGAFRGPQPTFPKTQSLEVAPPPLSGGTLMVTSVTNLAVAADPDRDRIVIVDVTNHAMRHTVALSRGDEPGRAVEDPRGVVHVVLRGAGEVADVDVLAGTVLDRRAVCPAPRGIAYDSRHGNLLVACAGGELVTLPAAGGASTATDQLPRDLRDVVIDTDGTVMVTRLRTAEVLVLDGNHGVASTVRPPETDLGEGTFAPNTAWRAAPLPDGGVVMTYQRSAGRPVQITEGGYGGGGGFGCGGGGIVHSTASIIERGSGGGRIIQGAGPILSDVVLPIDVAVSPNGLLVAVLGAGNAYVPGAAQVMVTNRELLASNRSCGPGQTLGEIPGEPIAVAYTATGELLVQTREPAAIILPERFGVMARIDLGGESRYDSGHAIFHSNSSAGLACASCHPEGGDDARTWSFADLGPRRTQSLRGGITGRAPFHWSADEPDFNALVSDVFVGRMSGPTLDGPQTVALSGWIDRIPTLPPSALESPAAVERGRALFFDAGVGCAGCHNGGKLTNNQKVDVGTRGEFKTPSLVNVAARAPFLHDGCAATLRDRFGACGGGDRHGHTSQLSPDQLGDLVSYLETL